jgi:rSAM/selenodomain-associated transferase 1
VKTRLQPLLTPEEAAQLNVCFLRDIAAAIVSIGRESRGVGVFTPVGSEHDYVDVLPSDFVLIPQRGNSFGERLMNTVTDLLRVGFKCCCLINSDSPTVTADAFRQAVVALQGADNNIVLGPSDDGGYYLIGMRKAYRRLFEDIDWSTERVFAQTLDRARERKLNVHVLPKCYDIDDATALRRLCGELLDEKSGDVAPATRKFLAELVARDGPERFYPPSALS